jgi:NADPH-dependent ferric siderophore reductase
MTFSYTIGTDLSDIRLRIGDTIYAAGVRPRGANFSDEEITRVLTLCDSNVDFAIAMLLETLSNEWAKIASITVGPVRQDYTSVSKQFAKQADDTRMRLGIDSKSFAIVMKRMDGYQADAEDTSA